jgi:hypothetical protein
MSAYDLLKVEDPHGVEAFQALAGQYPDDAVIAYHSRRIAAGATSSLIVLEDK